MYMEEIKDHEQIRNKEEEGPSKSTNANGSSTSEPNVTHKATEETTIIKKAKNNSNSLLGSIEAKPEETNNQELLMRFMAGATGHGDGSFGADPIVELSGFAAEQLAPRFSGNAISLTLGLQHSENLSLANRQTSFLQSESIWAGGWR